MIIHITKHNLLEGLNAVTRAIPARASKPIMEGVMVQTIDDGILLTCTDGTMTIRARVEGEIEKSGQTVMPGKILMELVRKLPEGMVDIQVNDKNIAVVKCLSSRTSLSCLSPIDFPLMQPIENSKEVKFEKSLFKDMINRVIFAIATDDARQILTGCLLEVTASELRLVGLDGFRLAMQRCSSGFTYVGSDDASRLSAIIPGKVLAEMGKILTDDEGELELSFDKSRFYAKFSDVEISSVLLAGEYINYRQILPADWKTRLKVKREDLSNAIERASLMAREGKNNLLKLYLTQEDMTITSAAELGDMQETLPIEFEGENMEIAFNARYLSDVIRNISDNELTMRFNSNVSPCVICPAEGEDYLYLVLPVRVF